jgi:predicted dehydrogenase
MPVEDDAHFLVEYEDESTGTWYNTHLEGSWSYRDSPETCVLGTIGSITIEGDGAKIVDAFGGVHMCAPSHGRFLNQPEPPGFGGHAQQVKNMCQCILQGHKPQCDERIGAESMAIAGAAYLSQQRGRVPVSIEEFKEYAKDLEAKHGDQAAEVLLDEAMKGVSREQKKR